MLQATATRKTIKLIISNGQRFHYELLANDGYYKKHSLCLRNLFYLSFISFVEFKCFLYGRKVQNQASGVYLFSISRLNSLQDFWDDQRSEVLKRMFFLCYLVRPSDGVSFIVLPVCKLFSTGNGTVEDMREAITTWVAQSGHPVMRKRTF